MSAPTRHPAAEPGELSPAREAERLGAVHRYAVLDTPPDGGLDRITALAARLLRVPIAIVSIVDKDRIWLKSRYGIELEAVNRDPGFCASAILQSQPWVVNDASADPVVSEHPLVAGEPGLRFYAGVPLKTRDGNNIGALCVIDVRPRQLSDEQLAILIDLAELVMSELELRRQAQIRASQDAALTQHADQRFRIGFETSPVGMALLDLQGRFQMVNPALCGMLARPDATLRTMTLAELAEPNLCDDDIDELGRMLSGEISSFQEERCYRRPDGRSVWALLTVALVRDSSGRPDYFFAHVHDVTARRHAEEGLRARAAQQSAVATLGRRALSGAAVNQLIDEAVDAVGLTLGNDGMAIFEVRDSNIVLVRGTGCWEGLAAPAELPVGADSQARYTMATSEAVTVEDLGSESRFTPPALLLKAGMLSSVSVSITVAGRPYGAVAVYRAGTARFSDDDATFLQAVANVIGMTIERPKHEEAQDLIQRHAHLGSWEVDLVTGSARWSDELHRILGYEPGQVGTGIEASLAALDPETAERATEVADLLKVTHQPVESTHRIVRPNGDVRWVFARSEAVFSDEGVPIRFWGSVLDITDLRTVEADLRAAELRFRAGFEQSPVGMSLQSPDGRFLMVNPALCEMLGRSDDELREMNVAEICHPEVVDTTVAAMTRMLSSETGSFQSETRWLRSDGQVVWLSMNISLVHDDRMPDYFFFQVQDITETRRSERRNRSLAELRCKALTGMTVERSMDEAVKVVATALNLDYGVIHTLRTSGDVDYATSFGWSAPSVRLSQDAEPAKSHALYTLARGEPVMVTDFGQEKRFEPPQPLVSQGLVSGLSVVITVRGRPYGVLAAYSKRIQRFSAGDLGFVQAVADLVGRAVEQRDHDEAENRLRQQERLAAVGQLAAGVAHDFNNIVSAVSLYSELLEGRQQLDDAGMAHLAAIREQVERATVLVWQILDFAHRSPLELVDVDLSAFLIGLRPVLAGALPDDVEICLVDEGGPYVVEGDPTRLQQIFLNLATNASDAFDGPGKFTITLSHDDAPPGVDLLDGPQERPWVRADIVDTGRGMPPEVLARAFEPFFTSKPPGGGTGLGLSQVHGLVSQHGGHVVIASPPDGGTVVSIWLRTVTSNSCIEQAPSVHIPRSGGEQLVVADDDPAVRTALGEVLESLGYAVRLAADGEEALTVLEHESSSTSGLVSDIAMPGMGGEALSSVVNERWPGLPVILISGYLTPPSPGEHQPRLADDPANQVGPVRLAKPFTREKLAETLSRALKQAPLSS